MYNLSLSLYFSQIFVIHKWIKRKKLCCFSFWSPFYYTKYSLKCIVDFPNFSYKPKFSLDFNQIKIRNALKYENSSSTNQSNLPTICSTSSQNFGWTKNKNGLLFLNAFKIISCKYLVRIEAFFKITNSYKKQNTSAWHATIWLDKPKELPV